MFISALEIVAVVFLLAAIGFLCRRKGWLGDGAATVLSRVTLRVSLPALIVSNVLTHYDRSMLRVGARSLLVPAAVILAMYLLSAPMAKWLRIPPQRRGVFRALFSFSNTMFIGLPVCTAIFGDVAAGDVMLCYLANTVLWWLIGAPNVAKDAGKEMQGSLPKRLATPPLIACFVSILLVLAGVTLPGILMRTASMLGAMVTPLSMLFVGIMLCDMVAGGIRWQKGYGWILAARALLGPLISLPLCHLLGLGGMTTGVFLLQMGMPAQTQTCLWAEEKGADAQYAAGGVALSTLSAVVVIPAYTWLLTLL